MKKFALFLALGSFGSLFFGESYSMIPTVELADGSSPSPIQKVNNTEMFAEQLGERTYIDTHLKKKDVLNKSDVVVTEDNVDEIIRTFSYAFKESLRKAGDVAENGASEFLDTLYTQKDILGKTAKEVMEIFEDLADKQFPSVTETLFQEIRNIKFITHGSTLNSVKREEVLDTCCSILRAISYRYLEAQEMNTAAQRSYPHYRGAIYQQELQQLQQQRFGDKETRYVGEKRNSRK